MQSHLLLLDYWGQRSGYIVSLIMSADSPVHVNKIVVEYGSLVHILGQPFNIFSKYVKVFDLYFVATHGCPDEKILHGASVLYQYIDNDDDGIPDNADVYSELIKMHATMIMFYDEKEHKKYRKFYSKNEKCKDIVVQDLQAFETRPGSMIPHKFDASLEECFHLLTLGFCAAYPDVFGCKPGSVVANALDCARGGHFKKVPKKYPEHAWFTYYDRTCDYEAMIIEYVYWTMTSILGAQQHRKEEVEDEWRHCSPEDVQRHDSVIFNLLTDEKYKFPSKLPIPLSCIPIYDIASPCSTDSSESD